MQNFVSSLHFIVAFLILTIFIQMIAGTQIVTDFLWLVLFGMIVTNSDKITALIGKGFSQ